MRINGAVGVGPVNGKPQGREKMLENFLVFNSEFFTQLDEVIA